MAAREVGGLSLADALSLCAPMAELDPARYERAALRWLQRFIGERLPPLAEVALAASALSEVQHGDRAVAASWRARPRWSQRDRKGEPRGGCRVSRSARGASLTLIVLRNSDRLYPVDPARAGPAVKLLALGSSPRAHSRVVPFERRIGDSDN
jgi:hypothetical protein